MTRRRVATVGDSTTTGGKIIGGRDYVNTPTGKVSSLVPGLSADRIDSAGLYRLDD